MSRWEILSTEDGQEEQVREDVDADQGPDTLGVDWPDYKFDSPCVRVSELLSVLSFLIRQ